MSDIERALQQSMNDDYDRLTSRAVGTSETSNVNKIFENLDTIGECLICCDDDKVCAKCFKCTAIYCKDCLIKISSDFNKCSTCSVELKKNYGKILDYNQALQAEVQFERAIAASINDYISDSASSNDCMSSMGSNSSSNCESDFDEDSIKYNRNLNQNRIPNQSRNRSRNGNRSLTLNTISNINLNAINNLATSISSFDSRAKAEDTSYNRNESNPKSIDIMSKKRQFLKDLKDDKIYNIDFKTYIDKISPTTPNYSYEWNHNDKTLTLYTLCNQGQDINDIVIKYSVLGAKFQAEIYPWLNKILELPINKFKLKWNAIATKINKFSVNNQTERIKLVKDIIDICNDRSKQQC